MTAWRPFGAPATAAAAMPNELQPRKAAPTWDVLPLGEKQAWLLALALDRKREILSLPLPDESDDSLAATRLRALIMAAADSTVNQSIALRGLAPAAAEDTHAQELETIIEERRQKARAMIAKMRELDD